MIAQGKVCILIFASGCQLACSNAITDRKDNSSNEYVSVSSTTLTTTRWRYVRPITTETTVLDVSTPKNIQLCLDNLGISVNFQVTNDQCSANPAHTETVSTGCSSFGNVRKVTILQSQNPNAYAAGGLIKHVDFDADPGSPPIDRSIEYKWSYVKGNRSDIYKDSTQKARVMKVCVAKGAPENGWGVNFKSKGHPCNPATTNTFAITGVVNSRYQVPSACAIVEASELWIEGESNPGGPAEGTYQFLR